MTLIGGIMAEVCRMVDSTRISCFRWRGGTWDGELLSMEIPGPRRIVHLAVHPRAISMPVSSEAAGRNILRLSGATRRKPYPA